MMRRRLRRLAVPFFVLGAGQGFGADDRPVRQLFPVAPPLEQGILQVSDIHSIAYSVYGNRAGKPVFVLHGGPGTGCYPRLTQYFDPDKFFIVLHDQRGAGQSKPLGELRQNTIGDLVQDIERLRRHLNVGGKILVFGGSWGSTLALAYAETHPDRVSGMVIRGVWTCTKGEIEHGFRGLGIRNYFPDAWTRLEASLPPG
ncbi:MAG: alpha/beta fold hydrolase, partial [Phycisphaerae bacterium]